MKNLSVFVLGVVLITACSRSQGSIEPPPPAPYSSPTPISQEYAKNDPMLDAIRTSFSSGPHAKQYSCENCHGTSVGTGKELIWLDSGDGHSEDIKTSTELCLKCHPEQQTQVSFQNQSVHPHATLGCTNCHNAHTTRASCATSSCHGDLQIVFYNKLTRPEPHPKTGDSNFYMCGGKACHATATQIANTPIYHQPIHNRVPCYVCHDGSGLEVARAPDQSWYTVASQASSSQTEQTPIVSHTLQRKVDCSKCHFKGNSWGLIEIIPPK